VELRRFAFPTDIRFGVGARAQLPAALVELGLRRPLVVTDRGVAGLEMFGELHMLTGGSGGQVATFDEVHGNPTLDQVTAGVVAHRAHRADGVVAVGGGAALDVAKAVALMATHPGTLLDYEDEVPGSLPVSASVTPIVALPTTAGTGSEVGRSAVISDADGVKRIVFSPHLMPRVVLADPQLTVGLPASITAATGMDAVTHNVEAFLSPVFHPICDGIALEGLRLASAALPTAVHAPEDLSARGDMLMA
jgi:alcohol dehydrogenase class IV